MRERGSAMTEVEQTKLFNEVWENPAIYALIHAPEARVLFDIASELPEGSLIVEIGCYEGKSTSVLASVADRRNLKLYCVDPLLPFIQDIHTAKDGPFNGGVPVTEETLEVFKRNILDVYKNVTWAGYGVTSEEAAKTMNEPIDFIFLDADHSYAACKIDCESWLPKLKPGHCATFHDINNVAFIGVQHAVEEYCVGWKEVNSVWNLKTFRKPM